MMASMDVQRSLDIARKAVERCHTLARLSEEEDRTTRTFLTSPMHEVHRLVRSWMENVGLTVTVDALGNLRGSLQGSQPGASRLLIGSHLDTVPGAGAFDGVLGVMLALGLVEGFDSEPPECGIEILGFSEEEGVRFGVPFLGSRAIAGTFDRRILERTDARGITMAQAIREFGLDPHGIEGAAYLPSVLGYVALHLEQGPMLGSLDIPLGVVDSI